MKEPSESQEQCAFFDWCKRHSKEYRGLEKIYAIPNGGERDKANGHRMKLEGLRAGVPDMCLPVACGRYHSLYIEMKVRSGGRISEKQQTWIAALREEGHKVAVCKGFKDARAVVMDYYDE